MEHIIETTGNVVPWRRTGDWMQSAALNTLRAYWEALRDEAGGAIPPRTAVNPRGIANALEYAFIVERVDDGAARMRLAGQHLNALMGMEVRGMPLSALFLPEARTTLDGALAAVFSRPAIADFDLRPAPVGNAAGARARMLMLPLIDRDGRIGAALGGLVSAGVSGAPPQRFRIDAQSVLPCAAGAVAAPPAPQPAPGFAEPATGFDGARRPPRRGRPHLRVVKPDD